MKFRYAALSDIKGIYNLVCELEMEEMPFMEFEDIYTVNIDRKNIH